MSRLRILYHMARADFFERTRRYSFLVMLGMVVWLGYASASRKIHMAISPNYIGEINSAWVGALMTLTVTVFLGWFGFYLIKGSVSRDYETGVGQIIATTPLTRPLYMLGKWASNFAVLGVMILVLMAVGILMDLLVGISSFNMWALVAPLLFVALPCMALVAAFAVLFESIRWLRGGLGNVAYFFLFNLLIIPGLFIRVNVPLLDFIGIRLIGDSIAAAAKAADPESGGGFSFAIMTITAPKVFPWSGIHWTAAVILSRLMLPILAMGMVLLSAAFFDRFNPSTPQPRKKKCVEPGAFEPLPIAEAAPASSGHLTALGVQRNHFRFDALFKAELRLFLKGQRWWWYAIALGLVAGQVFSPMEAARYFLVVAWAWQILLCSALGSRESRYDTRQIVFSAPHPLANQLPAAWLAAFTVTALIGAGAALRYILAGDFNSLLAWTAGALFIPSLALALGVLTGSGKAFEVIYMIWIYLLLQKVPALDFAGMTPESPWYFYAPMAFLLLILAAFARQWQLTRQ